MNYEVDEMTLNKTNKTNQPDIKQQCKVPFSLASTQEAVFGKT